MTTSVILQDRCLLRYPACSHQAVGLFMAPFVQAASGPSCIPSAAGWKFLVYRAAWSARRCGTALDAIRRTLLAFSLIGFLCWPIWIQRLQAYLPLQPAEFLGTPNVTPDLAFNTAI